MRSQHPHERLAYALCLPYILRTETGSHEA